MKKTLFWILVFALILALAACGASAEEAAEAPAIDMTAMVEIAVQTLVASQQTQTAIQQASPTVTVSQVSPMATLVPSIPNGDEVLGIWPGLYNDRPLTRADVDVLVKAGGYLGIWNFSTEDPQNGSPVVPIVSFGGNNNGQQVPLRDVEVARAVCSRFPGSDLTLTWDTNPGDVSSWKGMKVPMSGDFDFAVPDTNPNTFWTCHGPGNLLPPTWEFVP